MRECIYPEDSVFVTGVAKVTREDAINAMYGTFSLSLIIDGHTGMILNASANMVMQDTVEFLKDILIGRNLLTDGEAVTLILKKRFLALSQKPLLPLSRMPRIIFCWCTHRRNKHSSADSF